MESKSRMSDTELMILQAAREIGINRDGNNAVKVTAGESGITAEFRSRQGDQKSVSIDAEASFTTIHEALLTAWKGKQ